MRRTGSSSRQGNAAVELKPDPRQCMINYYGQFRQDNSQSLLEQCQQYGVGSDAWPLSEWEPNETLDVEKKKQGKRCMNDFMWSSPDFGEKLKEACPDSINLIERVIARRNHMLLEQKAQKEVVSNAATSSSLSRSKSSTGATKRKSSTGATKRKSSTGATKRNVNVQPMM